MISGWQKLTVLAVAVVALVACQVAEYPAPIFGSSYRIGNDTPAGDSEITIDVMTTPFECANAQIEDIENCRPSVDRAAGEVRLSMLLRDPTTLSEVVQSLDRDQVRLHHDKTVQEDFDLVPFDPVSTGQLYILVIDGSGSMHINDGERIKKVYQALLSKGVVERFFPSDGQRSGVVLLRFTNEVVGLDGGPPRVITSRSEYTQAVRNHLMARTGGFTFLFNAVKFVLTDLLSTNKEIRDYLITTKAPPTVILLTDGFNNEASTDTCRTNVDRLQSTLDVVKEIRRSGASLRPTLYTIGLGKPYGRHKKPDGLNQSVTAFGLCGIFADNPIDAGTPDDLEDFGIDHVSLQWLAEFGGGYSYVRDSPSELAQVFQEAAAQRYRWYQVRYKVPDNFWHRKGFTVRLSLVNLARAFTEVDIHPNPWLDAPTGTREPGERWSKPTPFAHTATLVMPLLGLLVLLTFTGPALFNARRAVFRRAKPRK